MNRAGIIACFVIGIMLFMFSLTVPSAESSGVEQPRISQMVTVPPGAVVMKGDITLSCMGGGQIIPEYFDTTEVIITDTVYMLVEYGKVKALSIQNCKLEAN